MQNKAALHWSSANWCLRRFAVTRLTESMLRRGPSKLPFVHRQNFDMLQRQYTDFFAVDGEAYLCVTGHCLIPFPKNPVASHCLLLTNAHGQQTEVCHPRSYDRPLESRTHLSD